MKNVRVDIIEPITLFQICMILTFVKRGAVNNHVLKIKNERTMSWIYQVFVSE